MYCKYRWEIVFNDAYGSNAPRMPLKRQAHGNNLLVITRESGI